MEQKKSLVRNLAIILFVAVLIAVVAVLAATSKRTLEPTGGVLEADPTATAQATDAAEATQAPADGTEAASPAKAYLVVTVAGTMYEPIPLAENGRYTVRRGDMVNVIEVTEDSIRMAESSCDNQDCVEQGVVNLENRENRVLQNMVICLPNEVVLEIYTPEELTELLLGMLAMSEEENPEGTDE